MDHQAGNHSRGLGTEKWAQYKRLWGQLYVYQHSYHRVPEGGEREKGAENIPGDTVSEDFLNLGNKTDIQVQESQSPKQDKPK